MRKKHGFIKTIAFLACAGVVLASFLRMTQWQSQVVSYFLYPVIIVEKSIVVPIKQYFYRRTAVQDLVKLSQNLRDECEDLRKKNIALESSLDYIKNSRECRDFCKRYDAESKLVTQIIVKNFSPQSHFFLVDVGSHKGVTQDMVAVYKNMIVGRVIEVYPFYSKVVLITDESCQLSAKCLKTGAQGIHKGTNGKATELAFVSHLETVELGDTVISHGTGLIFPRGFALGTICSVEKQDIDYEIKIEPLVDFKALEFCALIKKGDY